MKEFMYVAWFRDIWLDEKEQDHKWCACFIIKANESKDAKSWDDHLATSMCNQNEQEKFLWSEVHNRDDSMYSEENYYPKKAPYSTGTKA